MSNLITEAASPNQIINIMKARRVATIDYDPQDEDGVKGYRYVEIYAYGTTQAGNPCIIGWIRNNQSATLNTSNRPNDKIRWRIFRLDKIRSLKYGNQTYDTSLPFINAERPKLNLNYRNLGSVFYKIIPDPKTTTPEDDTTKTDIEPQPDAPKTRPGELKSTPNTEVNPESIKQTPGIVKPTRPGELPPKPDGKTDTTNK